jgi:hypothetical protein
MAAVQATEMEATLRLPKTVCVINLGKICKRRMIGWAYSFDGRNKKSVNCW